MKRTFDIVVSLAGIIFLFPLILLVWCLVRVKLGKPAFFIQERPGLAGRTFHLLKFRSMLDLADKNGVLLDDAQRLTRFGKVLRSSSLDELPGLWNVIKGDMSLVGPRPLLVEYLPLYSSEQARRHEVRPGITGWAQINGRNAISWEEKFTMDVWYVDNRSFWLDLKIIFLTIKKVFFREDISAVGEATTSKFTGSDKK